MKTLITALVLGMLAMPAMAYEAVEVSHPEPAAEVLNTVDQGAICSASTELADAIEEKNVNCPIVE